MTEADWLANNDLPFLIKYLRGIGRQRKLRLFACACVRRVWDLLSVGNGRKAVAVAERFADAGASAEELAAAHAEGMKAWSEAKLAWVSIVSCGMSVAIEEASAAALYTTMHAPDVKSPAGSPHRRTEKAAERYAQLALLRDIFGNPFRPTSPLAPAVLSWHDATVVRLAQAAYDERHMPEGTLDNGRLAVLADSLEEAGGSDADILGHLRGPGPHVRGCWVVDLLLGKS